MDKRRIIPIPENFHSGISIFGGDFAIIRVIEAAVIGTGVFLLVFVPLSYFHIDLSSRIGIAAAAALPGVFLGLKGIENEALSKRLVHIYRHYRNHDVLLYNPRVKVEARSVFDREYAPLPKEVIIGLYESYRKKTQQKERESARELLGRKGNEEVVFADDLELMKEKKGV